MRRLLEEGPGGDGLASEQTLQILRRAASSDGAGKSVRTYADAIVEEATGSCLVPIAPSTVQTQPEP